jgi:tetratricopeptide (TPR) repeat protein
MNRPALLGNRKLLLSLLLAACAAAPHFILCQAVPQAGQIAGSVAGPSGAAIAGAQIVLRTNESGAEQKRTVSDNSGNFTLTEIPLGAYKLSANASGFRDSDSKLVILSAVSATVNFTLLPLDSVTPNGGKTPLTASDQKKAPLTFSPSGVRGTIAPSGYSTGLSSEETSRVRARAGELEPSLFATLASAGANVDCAQEPALLHAVQQAPQDFAANHALGDFYLGHGDYTQAIRYFEAARALSPSDRGVSIDLALALIGAARGADAVALLETLQADRGSDATRLQLLALAYDAAGQTEKASAAYQKAAASDPGADNQYNCGIGLLHLGFTTKARDLFSAASATHPESARIWLGLGIAEHLLERKEAAVAALLHSSDSDSSYLPPLSLLAELSGLTSQTQADLRRRIAAYLVAHPDDADARFTYALALSKQDTAEASMNSRLEIVTQLKRALAFNPRMARAHFLLGDAEANAGDLAGAIDEFVAGLKLEPDDARAHYRLSLLYRRSGQQDRAREEVDKFRSLRPKTGDDQPSPDGAGVLPLPAVQLAPVAHPCTAAAVNADNGAGGTLD